MGLACSLLLWTTVHTTNCTYLKASHSKCPDGNLEGQSPAPPFTGSCDPNITDNSESRRISPGLAILRMKQRMPPRLGAPFLNLRALHTSPCHPTNLCSQSTGWRLEQKAGRSLKVGSSGHYPALDLVMEPQNSGNP